MRKNFIILLIALICVLLIASVGANFLLTPHYKTIDLNGYSFEVPESNDNISTINDNYKVYEDKEHHITVKSYAINNINETNYTGAYDIGQLESNKGQNCTYDNVSMYNNSGTYSYFDNSTYQMIVISCSDVDTMSHIIKSMNKTDVIPTSDNLTLNLTSLNNTTDQDNTQSKSSSTSKQTTKTSNNNKKSYSSSSSQSDEIYDVPVPGSPGKTVRARWTGTSPEYGARYEEVGTGRAIYH